MNQIALVKQQVSLASWIEEVRQCKSSGLTVMEWCKTNGINPKTYYYHQKKVRQNMIDTFLPEDDTGLVPASSGTTVPAKEDPVSFRKLEVSSPVQSFNPAVVVHLPSATLEINSGVDQQTVEAVLLALKVVC